MTFTFKTALLLGLAGMAHLPEVPAANHEVVAHSDRSIKSEIVETEAKELVLIQELVVEATLDQVWNAYTTADGWTAWAAPMAEVDLRVGGTIRTAYSGEIGGDTTNTLHIVNYVPSRLLTLRADVSDNWPEIMKKDADNLTNVIVFDQFSDGEVRIQSYGIGYSDAPEYRELMDFFITANEGLLGNLCSYLESGVRANWVSPE